MPWDIVSRHSILYRLNSFEEVQKIYLHFLSFLDNKNTRVIVILHDGTQGPVYPLIGDPRNHSISSYGVVIALLVHVYIGYNTGGNIALVRSQPRRRNPVGNLSARGIRTLTKKTWLPMFKGLPSRYIKWNAKSSTSCYLQMKSRI